MKSWSAQVAWRISAKTQPRFAKLAPQIGSGLVQSLERLFFAGGFGLFARQRIAILGIERVQINHVMTAQARDRAGEHRLDALAQADLARHIFGQALVR